MGKFDDLLLNIRIKYIGKIERFFENILYKIIDYRKERISKKFIKEIINYNGDISKLYKISKNSLFNINYKSGIYLDYAFKYNRKLLINYLIKNLYLSQSTHYYKKHLEKTIKEDNLNDFVTLLYESIDDLSLYYVPDCTYDFLIKYESVGILKSIYEHYDDYKIIQFTKKIIEHINKYNKISLFKYIYNNYISKIDKQKRHLLSSIIKRIITHGNVNIEFFNFIISETDILNLYDYYNIIIGSNDDNIKIKTIDSFIKLIDIKNENEIKEIGYLIVDFIKNDNIYFINHIFKNYSNYIDNIEHNFILTYIKYYLNRKLKNIILNSKINEYKYKNFVNYIFSYKNFYNNIDLDISNKIRPNYIPKKINRIV